MLNVACVQERLGRAGQGQAFSFDRGEINSED